MKTREEEIFCEKIERGGLSCKPQCFDHVCDIKGREQRLYGDLKAKDTITITRNRDGEMVVETDIEVPYHTQYPFPRSSGKLPEFNREMQEKEVILTMAVGNKLKEASIETVGNIWYHRHYRENTLPDTPALHVHVQAKPKDIPEATKVAKQLQTALDGEWLTKLIE